MMFTKSLTCSILALSIPFLATSCADLRDADRCYRLARLTCEKSCEDPDSNGCIERLKTACYDDDEVEASELDECSDKLAELDDCAGGEAVFAACAEPSKQVGATCTSISDCPEGLGCYSGICSSSCYYDDSCSPYRTANGGLAYCNGDGNSSGICIGVCTSDSDCSGGWTCNNNGAVKTCSAATVTVPQPKGAKLGDPCDSALTCDSTTSDQCSAGYCTKSCQSQSACSGLTSDGGSLACARFSSGAMALCLPTCIAASDCAPGSVCKSAPTPEGLTRSVCFEDSAPTMTGTKLSGQACASASDCSSSGARCEGYCTQSCTSDSQCTASSGSRTSGRCISSASTGGSICMPGCSPGLSGQCEGGSSCVAVSVPTGTANVCRPASSPATSGRVGDKCATTANCNQADNLMCAGSMCTKICEDGDSCPSASKPNESICANIVDGLSGITGCTITCEDNGCLPGWTCLYDELVDREVCSQQR